jgi:hypothetical protein
VRRAPSDHQRCSFAFAACFGIAAGRILFAPVKEIKDILERVSEFSPQERAILATVVDVRGSGYRLPGARMLILENGDTFGMISGGCLEADVLERAKKVLKSGDSEIFTYDTTTVEDSVFSLNMGCRGVVRILLESIGPNSILIEYLRRIRNDRKSRTIATLIGTERGSEVVAGGRLFLSEGEFESEGLPEFLGDRDAMRNECSRFERDGRGYGFQAADRSFSFRCRRRCCSARGDRFATRLGLHSDGPSSGVSQSRSIR